MILEPLLTKQAVATILGYHPQTVMRLVRENKLPKPVKAGGDKSAVRFRANDIVAWIDQHVGVAAQAAR